MTQSFLKGTFFMRHPTPYISMYKSKKISDGDPDPLWKRILIHISGRLDSIFNKHFLFTFKISKTFVFFFWTSSEYLTRYGHVSVFKIHFQGSVVKIDPCLYFFEYSPNVLKKKIKVLDAFNTDNFVFYEYYYRIKSSRDMDSCRSFSLLKAIAKRLSLLFAIAFIIYNII